MVLGCSRHWSIMAFMQCENLPVHRPRRWAECAAGALGHTSVFSFCTGFNRSSYQNHLPGNPARPQKSLRTRARKVKQLPAPIHTTRNRPVMGKSPVHNHPKAVTCEDSCQLGTASAPNNMKSRRQGVRSPWCLLPWVQLEDGGS